jgi:excisionase family DNA binding protein
MTASANPGAPTTFTAQQLAAELHVSVASIMRRIHDGSLPAFRIGRFWRIRAEVVEALKNGEL